MRGGNSLGFKSVVLVIKSRDLITNTTTLIEMRNCM